MKKDNKDKELEKTAPGMMPLVSTPKIEGQSSPKPITPKDNRVKSTAPAVKKNPLSVARQIKNPVVKDFVIGNAKAMRSSPGEFSGFLNQAEQDNTHYHITQNGQRITNDPLPVSEINAKHGGIKHLESNGFVLVPVHKEKLDVHPNGQWKLKSK